MNDAVEIVQYVNLGLYTVVAAAAVWLWWRHRERAGLWAALAFVALAAIVDLGRLLPDGPDQRPREARAEDPDRGPRPLPVPPLPVRDQLQAAESFALATDRRDHGDRPRLDVRAHRHPRRGRGLADLVRGLRRRVHDSLDAPDRRRDLPSLDGWAWRGERPAQADAVARGGRRDDHARPADQRERHLRRLCRIARLDAALEPERALVPDRPRASRDPPHRVEAPRDDAAAGSDRGIDGSDDAKRGRRPRPAADGGDRRRSGRRAAEPRGRAARCLRERRRRRPPDRGRRRARRERSSCGRARTRRSSGPRSSPSCARSRR